ncbi:MAG: hypothetical protein ABUT20_62840, partial [Bacteroidota bacterium]
MKNVFVYVLLIVMIAISCSKQINDNNSPGTGGGGSLTEAGYGASDKPFTSPAWSLPAGVELKDSIHEYSYCWAFPPGVSVPPKDWKGIPSGFPFCFTLSNKTNGPITVPFPPDLVFISSSALHQNVLVIDLGTIQLPANATITFVAQGFCLNEGRTIPQVYIDNTEKFLTYSFGPSQIPAALKEITGIVESKHIGMSDVTKEDGTVDNDKASKYFAIQ